VQLLSTAKGHKIFLRCPLADYNEPELVSISSIYRGAEWHEREIFDLFGIRFTDHPDLRRIFLKDDFPGFPMRKDFSDPTRVVRRPY
jgi:NADH:ubiquinone oxidoreductase subunit C